ncbi:MAG: alpha/beta hydrolase [Gemmatimonadaceae bacterium]
MRVCCACLVLTAVMAAPARAQLSTLRDPPPTGQLVDVGGYRVHLACSGRARGSDPTVVIVGAGASFEWDLVTTDLAGRARVCAYDHSGSVWSDDGPTDSCVLRVREVATALERVHITGTLVVVGHSIGALVARLFADQYSDRVAGLVLVDHATNTPVRNASLPAGDRAVLGSAPPVGTGGVIGHRVPLGEGSFAKLPASAFSLHQWAATRPRDVATRQHSPTILGACEEALSAQRARTQPLGDRFVAVLHVNNGEAITKTQGTSPYARLQQQLAALSRRSHLIQVDRSSHFMMLDRPDVVIAAIDEALNATKRRR